MIPYLMLATYVLFCWFLYNLGVLGRAPFLVACLVPAWVLLAFRGASVGEDTSMYLGMAEVARSLPWNSVLPPWGSLIWNMNEWGYGSSVDNGYLILCKLIMGVTGSSQSVLAICSAVICICFGRFLYLGDEDVAQSLWCFLCGGLYMFAFNGMRQMLAVAIALLCCKPLREGRWLRAVVIVLLAALIHKSALVFFFIIALFMLISRRRAFSVAVIVSCLLPVLVNAAEPLAMIISPQYASYYSNNYWDVSVGGIVFFWVAIAICSVILARGGTSSLDKGISVCGICYLMLELSSLRASILERAAIYFLPFVCLLVPRAAGVISDRNRWWFKLGINLLLFAVYLSYVSSPARVYVLFS